MVPVMVLAGKRVAAGCRVRESRIPCCGLPLRTRLAWFLSPVRLPVPPLQCVGARRFFEYNNIEPQGRGAGRRLIQSPL